MEQQTRTELKYVITIAQYLQIKRALGPLVDRDPVAVGGGYRVFSTYFDTADMEYFEDKVDGFENRVKFRIRSYDDPFTMSKNRFIVFEIKERKNTTMVKYRLQISAEQAEKLMHAQGRDDFRFLPKQYMEFIHKKLTPTVVTDYRREAFFQKKNRRLRLTFDFENRAFFFDRIAKRVNCVPQFTLPIDQGIFEIKTYEMIPRWLDELIHQLGLKQQKVSKYCLGVERWYGKMRLNRGL